MEQAEPRAPLSDRGDVVRRSFDADLGYWVEKQVRSGWLHGIAETGAVYLEAILAPHLQVLATSAELPQAERAAIAALIADASLSGRVAMIKIWNTKGELLFSTGRSSTPETLPSSLLQKVKNGQILVDVEFDDKGDHSPVPASGPTQTGKLLVLSQVILLLQLPFAVIP